MCVDKIAFYCWCYNKMLLDMSRGLISPGCDCWSVGQSASAIVFTLTLAPVLHSVCFDTYSIVIVLTCGPGGWINTSVSCLVKLPLWCCNYLTLVSLVLWVFTMTSTPLQLSWLVDRHGVGLLSLCFGWLIPKRLVVYPWPMGFTELSFMVNYLFSSTYYLIL